MKNHNMVAPVVLLVCRRIWTNGQMDGQMNRWKIQMEKHIQTHAHKGRHVQCTRTHCSRVHVHVCELVCGMAISFKNENHLADGKAQNTLTHGMCELVRVRVYECVAAITPQIGRCMCVCLCDCLHVYGVLCYVIAVMHVFFISFLFWFCLCCGCLTVTSVKRRNGFLKSEK